MGGTFVTQNNTTVAFLITGAFALHQHGDTVGQPVDLALLAADHIAQLVDSSGQVGDLLFEMLLGCLLGLMLSYAVGAGRSMLSRI